MTITSNTGTTIANNDVVKPTSNETTDEKPKGAVIVARHGERIDYVLRDTTDQNWIQTAARPWDPPLTSTGRRQARKLGLYLGSGKQQDDDNEQEGGLLKKLGLGPVVAVYSSPLIRCCQTASEAILGMQQSSSTNHDDDNNTTTLQVTLEPGLLESLNDKWYHAWCLPDSNGSWGGPNPKASTKAKDVDTNDIDPRAKIPVHTLLWDAIDVQEFLVTESSYNNNNDDDDSLQFKSAANLAPLINTSAATLSSSTIIPIQNAKYTYNNFETKEQLQDRMEEVVQAISRRHPHETVLLVSHGGPVTHLFERLVHCENSWNDFGVATYTSFSIYQKNGDDCDDDENNDNDGEGKWNAIVVNESCHVKDIQSADETKSFV